MSTLDPKVQEADEKAAALLIDMENRFVYHAPFGTQVTRYQQLRDGAKKLAYDMVGNCPQSRELSLALTKLEEATFWANAAIARNEKPEGVTGLASQTKPGMCTGERFGPACAGCRYSPLADQEKPNA